MSLVRRWWPTVLFFAVVGSMPLWITDGYVLQLIFRVLIFAVLGIAWNFIGGYAGQLSLGHVAYFGIGAYAMTLSAERIGWNPWLGVLLGMILAALGALIIGSITFRLRGPYFALSTIAAAEIIRVLVQNQDELTHGAVGTNAPLLFEAPNLDAKFFLGAVPILAGAFALATWIHGSRFGYRLRAIRENENTAMAVGVNPAVDKLKALIPSAVFTSLAGSVYASYFSFVGPDTVLNIEISVQAALIAMLGGAATVWGPILGSIVLTLTSEIFKNYFEHTHLVVYGLLLIVVVIFVPGGLVSLFQRRGQLRRQAGPIGSVQG
ncbi:MAG TPA: branched-chain amino acid ABC transporter permease [Myxococcaceae bacterium]|nr:branched-chain amino acid ABC transporter permease [Myxococcaceae bacterium]